MFFFEATNVMSHWKMFDGKNGHQFVETFVYKIPLHTLLQNLLPGNSLSKGIHGIFSRR